MYMAFPKYPISNPSALESMPGGNRCCVSTCGASSHHQSSGDPYSLKFFSFPRDECMFKEWCRLCCIAPSRRRNGRNPRFLRVCSQHFHIDDYEDAQYARLLKQAPRRLKKTAVPSLFIDFNGRYVTQFDPLDVGAEVVIAEEERERETTLCGVQQNWGRSEVQQRRETVIRSTADALKEIHLDDPAWDVSQRKTVIQKAPLRSLLKPRHLRSILPKPKVHILSNIVISSNALGEDKENCAVGMNGRDA